MNIFIKTFNILKLSCKALKTCFDYEFIYKYPIAKKNYQLDKAYLEFLLDNHKESLGGYAHKYILLELKLLDILIQDRYSTELIYHDYISKLSNFEYDTYVNINNAYKYFDTSLDEKDIKSLLYEFEDFRDGDIFRNELRHRKALRLYHRIKERILPLF